MPWRELGGCSWKQPAGLKRWHLPPRPPSCPPLPLPLPCPQNQLRARHGETASRPLVLTAKGRADVLLSLAAANVTGTGPHVAGIILTDAGRTVG